MGAISYITNVSLDGYIEDADGDFQFSEPSDEYFAFVTSLIVPLGGFLYGRRLYKAMSVWETDPSLAAQSDLYAAFAHAWQDSDKIVFSSTLDEPLTKRARIERNLDLDAVRELKATTANEWTVGGANLAAQLIEADLVDECHLFVSPIHLGGGKPGLPVGVRRKLELVDVHRFDVGTVYLRLRFVNHDNR